MLRRCPAVDSARTNSLFPDEVLGYYRALLSQLPGLGGPGGTSPLRTLGLTSCDSGEGVTTVAAQLAAAAARCRAGGVLLVDANLARPAAHQVFALQGGPGLAEILLKGEPPAGVLQPSGLANLTVLAAGLPAGAPGRLAQALDALPGALQALQSDFELVVLDLPACSAGPLTARLAGQLDGVLLVIAAEGTRREAVQREKDLLAQANARLLGAVLNKWRRYTPGWLQRYL